MSSCPRSPSIRSPAGSSGRRRTTSSSTSARSPRASAAVSTRPSSTSTRIHQQLTPAQRQVLGPAKTWNVQLQHVGRGKTAVRYLARYVRRSAFSAKRLLGYDGNGDVRLSWTSSATGRSAVMTLHPHEFIRRWLLHVLPKGLPRVRHYGFLSPAAGKTRLRLRALLGEFDEPLPQLPGLAPFACPHCGGALTFLRDIAPIRIPRGPPCKIPATA